MTVAEITAVLAVGAPEDPAFPSFCEDFADVDPATRTAAELRHEWHIWRRGFHAARRSGPFYVVIGTGQGAGSGWGDFAHKHGPNGAEERAQEMRDRGIDAIVTSRVWP